MNVKKLTDDLFLIFILLNIIIWLGEMFKNTLMIQEEDADSAKDKKNKGAGPGNNVNILIIIIIIIIIKIIQRWRDQEGG